MKIDWTDDTKFSRDIMRRYIGSSGKSTLQIRTNVRRMILKKYPELGKKWKEGKTAFDALVNAKAEELVFSRLRRLLNMGYVKTNQDELSFEEPGMISPTEAGYRFMNASFRRYNREAAKKQLDTFLSRCAEVNSLSPSLDDPKSFILISKVEVFGSYLHGTDELGDVDVYIEMGTKKDSTSRLFANADFGWDYPAITAMKYMKKNLSIISLHFDKDGLEGKTKFERFL